MAMIYRNYKDNVFCLLYRDRTNLLELYNALNGTDHRNPDELTVVTLPGTICVQYKNDAAFTFSRELYLCEQQSTENPNIPLRFLHYVSEEYRHIVPEKDLYRQNAVKIPAPHFVVFYNGTVPQPERRVYKLSELYEGKKGEPALEIRAVMLNINSGNNRELLQKCQTLQEYMQFVDKVRRIQKTTDVEAAVRQAVSECIAENILREFFQEYKEEVVGMSIWEFNEELYLEAVREDAMENGHNKGLREGCQQGILQNRLDLICRKLKKGKSAEQIAEDLEENLEELLPAINTARQFAPEYDLCKVLEALGSEKTPES